VCDAGGEEAAVSECDASPRGDTSDGVMLPAMARMFGTAQEQKSFASFLQKRRIFLMPAG
jgi:hypothetical protein